MTDRDRRRRANLRGHVAEWVAIAVLVATGHRILARRFSVAGGEVDVIARRGGTVVFVEVKARADLEAAGAAITEAKRRRVARAAAVWRARNPWAVGHTLRADAMLVAPRAWPRRIRDAFPLER